VLSYFLPHGFRAFYIELLESGDFVKAVDRLRQHTLPEYGGYAVTTLFRMGWQNYEEKFSRGTHLARRVKKILRRSSPLDIARAGSRNKARAQIARAIRNTVGHRDEFYRHFIMAGSIPGERRAVPFRGSMIRPIGQPSTVNRQPIQNRVISTPA
jgi:hypothetical protein